MRMIINRFLTSCLFAVYLLHARPDCIDNSHYLKNSYDNKEYHPIPDCTCPCTKRVLKQDRCERCGHAHIPKVLHILTKEETIDSSTTKKITLIQSKDIINYLRQKNNK